MGLGKILIIDDDEGIRTILQLTLQLEGYEVAVACNGKEGIDSLGLSHPPDLILLDLMMPVMDGWEFLKALETDSRLARIPVIVLTAAINEGRRITDHLVFEKPIDMARFLKTVGECCRP